VRVTFLLFKLANLHSELLCNLDTGRHFLLHSRLLSIEFIEPCLGRAQCCGEIGIFFSEGGDGLILVLQLYEKLRVHEHCARARVRTRSHTRSFSSVSRLREAASASDASGPPGGGVGLLNAVRRGELREADTRGLIAERAVAPLVRVVE